MTSLNMKVIEIETHTEVINSHDASTYLNQHPHTQKMRCNPITKINKSEKTRRNCILVAFAPQWQIVEGKM